MSTDQQGATIPSQGGRRRDLIFFCLILIVLATTATYWGMLRHDFTAWDDDQYVTSNSRVLAGLNGQGIRWAFSTDYCSNYHPLTWISLMIDAEVFGPRPWGFKLTNLILHNLNAILVFLLFVSMTSQIAPSFFVAALFSFHPLHVESVAWISERKDLLSTFFALFAMLSYVRYTRTGRLWAYGLMLLLFLASLLSKQMFVTLPALLLVLDWWPLKRLGKQDGGASPGPRQLRLDDAILEKLLPLGMAFGASALIYAIQLTNPTLLLATTSLSSRLANAVVAYAQYLADTFWPMNLAFFYPLPDGGHSFGTILGSAMVLIAITLVAFLYRRRAPYLLAGWLWFLGTLIPVIGLVQVGFQSRADRYTYFPLIGVFVMVVWSGWSWAYQSRARRFVFSLVIGLSLAACLFISTKQVATWQDTETLARRAMEVMPANPMAQLHLGKTLLFRGEWDDAHELLQNAVSSGDAYFAAHAALASLYLAKGEVNAAKSALEGVRRANPIDSVATYELGVIALGERKTKDAILLLTESLRRKPDQMETRMALALAYAQAENWEPADQLLRSISNYHPDAKIAREMIKQVAKGDPLVKNRYRLLFGWPPAVNGSRLLMMASLQHESAGRRDLAIKELRRALELWPSNVDALYNLAALNARSGQLEEALGLTLRVLELAPHHQGARDLAKLIRDAERQDAANAPAE